VMDTTFALTEYDGSTLPLLVTADSVLVDGVKELEELDLDAGTLVLSGLLQRRYQLDVRESVYRVVRTGDMVQRELRFQVVLEHDAGLVTVGANGNLTMVSELIGPHLEHTATVHSDGYLVHYHVAGTSTFLDLMYRRVTP